MEIWKPIVGFEGKYLISNFGRVKSISRRIGHGKGYIMAERILKPCLDQDGYLMVSFPSEGRKSKSKRVHKLVVTHFISDVLPPNFHICHKDGDIKNNHADNLYIGDVISNTIDKYHHGSTKLSIDQILSIRSLKGIKTQYEIADMFGVKQPAISRIMNGLRSKMIV